MRRSHPHIALASLLCLVQAQAGQHSDGRAAGLQLGKRRQGRQLAKVLNDVRRFFFSFERDTVGKCPSGWTCSNEDTFVCPLRHPSRACIFPGIDGVDGRRFLVVGKDDTTSEANSSIFTLPDMIDRVQVRIGGGADGPSGFYLHSSTGVQLCHVTNSADFNSLQDLACKNLFRHRGSAVFIRLLDARRGEWSKLLIDDIRLQDADGGDLSEQVVPAESGSHEPADRTTTATTTATTTTTASTTGTPSAPAPPGATAADRTTTSATTTITSTGTTTTTRTQMLRTVTFDANFDTVVGTQKALFLKECSAKLHPVECSHTRPGSILVDLKGEPAAVDDAVATVQRDGLDLPSFPKLDAATLPGGAWNRNLATTAVVACMLLGLISVAVGIVGAKMCASTGSKRDLGPSDAGGVWKEAGGYSRMKQEAAPVQEDFELAVSWVSNADTDRLPDEVQADLDGWHKQAKNGDLPLEMGPKDQDGELGEEGAPALSTAWQRCRGASSEEAMERYVTILDRQVPDWRREAEAQLSAPATGKGVVTFTDAEGQQSKLWVDRYKLRWAVSGVKGTCRVKVLKIEGTSVPGQYAIMAQPLRAVIVSPPSGDAQKMMMIELGTMAREAGVPVVGSGAEALHVEWNATGYPHEVDLPPPPPGPLEIQERIKVVSDSYEAEEVQQLEWEGSWTISFTDDQGDESKLFMDAGKLMWCVGDPPEYGTKEISELSIEETKTMGKYIVTGGPYTSELTLPNPGDEQEKLLVKLARMARRANVPVKGIGKKAEFLINWDEGIRRV